MFETLNAILGNDMLRATLLMGSGALLAYTVRPLPSAIDTFASCNMLKFGALFIFGASVMGELCLSRFMVLLFATLLIMVLFEYLRQADKGLSVTDTAAATAKEFMWGDDPTLSYPAAAPYADPRRGIPQYLPDGVTPSVTYVGHSGGRSNTGDFNSQYSPEDLSNPLEGAAATVSGWAGQGIDLAASAGSNLAAAVGMGNEHLSNPLEGAYDSIRDWSDQGIQAVSGVGAELAASAGLKNEHAFNPIATVRDLTEQGAGVAMDVGSDILSTVQGREQFVDLFNPLDVVFAPVVGPSQAIKVYDERLANPLDSLFALPVGVSQALSPEEQMRVCVGGKCWSPL
jgi:hypothetical protein